MDVEYGCLFVMLLGVCFMSWGEPHIRKNKRGKE